MSLVKHDREQLQKLRSKIRADAKHMASLVSRPNDVFYSFSNISATNESGQRPSVSVRLLPYSGQMEAAEVQIQACSEETQHVPEFMTGLKVFEQSEVRRLQRKWVEKEAANSSPDQEEAPGRELEVTERDALA